MRQKLTQSDLNLAQVLHEAIAQALHDRGQINILIAGKTGVGKSTLINAVFQGDLALTGQGRPVTTETREIRKEGLPLTIFDSRGLEVANYAETFGELEQFLAARHGESDPNRHVHASWVCLAEDIRRVEEAEVRLSEMLSRHVPVIGVITKARCDEGFRSEVQRLLPLSRNVVRVRALAETLDDGHRLGTMGLEELVELTMDVVPEGQRSALAAAQRVDLRQKVKQSRRIVVAATAVAAGAGAVPLPYSDAVALVPTQIGMLAGISATFGLPLSSAFLGTLVSGAIAGCGGTLGGRMLGGRLLKLVPGIGSVAGGMITASVAASLTLSLGEAYIAALCHLLKQHTGAEITPEQVAETFKTKLASGTAAVTE